MKMYGCITNSMVWVQVETSQEQVCELRLKIDEQRELSNKRAKQQQETLSSLRQTLQEKLSDAKKAETKLKHCNSMLNTMLNGIEDIFQLVRCDNAPILALLGNYLHKLVVIILYALRHSQG